MLSRRLATLHSFYLGGQSIWDIGCDHGQLGLSFLNHPEVETIHLVDPSLLVIEALRTHLKDSYITIPASIKIHHKKGQEILLDSKRKTIFIAGMGGKEILEIIQHLYPQMDGPDQLVISPHKNMLQVRKWLHSSPLKLHSEDVIEDEGRFYPVLVLGMSQTLPAVSLYGESFWKSETGKAYHKHEINTFLRHKDQISQDYVAFLSAIILN